MQCGRCLTAGGLAARCGVNLFRKPLANSSEHGSCNYRYAADVIPA